MHYGVTIETKNEGEAVCIFPRKNVPKRPLPWILAYGESSTIREAARKLASAHQKDMLVVVEKKGTSHREPVVLFETLGEEVLTEVDPRKELKDLRLTRFSEPKEKYPKSLEDFLQEP